MQPTLPGPIFFLSSCLGNMCGGYFGGAVGNMMMAVWSPLDGHDLNTINASRTLLISAANVTTVLIFIAVVSFNDPKP